MLASRAHIGELVAVVCIDEREPSPECTAELAAAECIAELAAAECNDDLAAAEEIAELERFLIFFF